MSRAVARAAELAAARIDRATVGDVSLDEQYRLPRGLTGLLVGRRMARQHAPENEWSVSLLAPRRADHVLEVGHGPGTTLERLVVLVPEGRVVGVDLSAAMVSAARRRNARAIRSGRLELARADAAELPFAPGTFDRALSVHCLYFWPDPDLALRELHRVLKPGGLLVLTLLPRERWPGGGEGSPTCRVYAGSEVASMLLRAGFSRAWVEPGDPARFRELAVLAVR